MLIMCRRRAHAVLVAVTALGAAALDTGFKHLYERARPPLTEQLTPETTFALPSGHSLGSTAVLGVLAVIGVLLLRRGVWRAGAVVMAIDGCADHRSEQAVPGRALAHRRPDGLAARWGVARDVRHRNARLPAPT